MDMVTDYDGGIDNDYDGNAGWNISTCLILEVVCPKSISDKSQF